MFTSKLNACNQEKIFEVIYQLLLLELLLYIILAAYDNCLLVDYPCQDEYCPPGFECYMYKPSDFCEGCGLQRACRPFTMPTTEVPQLN